MEERAISNGMEGKELYEALGLIPRKIGEREEGRSVINRLALILHDNDNNRVLAINTRFMYELFGLKLIRKFMLRAKSIWKDDIFNSSIKVNDRGELIVTHPTGSLSKLSKLYENIEPSGLNEYYFVSDNIGLDEFQKVVDVFRMMESALREVHIDVRLYYIDKKDENSVKFYHATTTAFDQNKLISGRTPNAILLKEYHTSQYIIGIHSSLWEYIERFKRLNKYIPHSGVITIMNCAGQPDKLRIISNNAIVGCAQGLIHHLNKDMLKCLKKVQKTAHIEQYKWWKFDSTHVDITEMHDGLKQFVRSFNNKIKKPYVFKIINL